MQKLGIDGADKGIYARFRYQNKQKKNANFVSKLASSALVNKNWTQGTTKTTWQLIKLYTTKFLAILLGGKVIEGIGRALLVEEDHIIIDFLSDRLITGHV